MFNKDFYPTPDDVIRIMVDDLDLNGKIILEPSAGKGNIVDYCLGAGASVIACEINNDLKKILQSKCQVIADDFLKVTSDMISHVDLIVMNPPFSADERHILHAWNIAPAGCKIRSVANKETIKNDRFSYRKELKQLVDTYGNWQDLGNCFAQAERTTNVEVDFIQLEKPGANYSSEFEGFFLDEDPKEAQVNGIMQYNLIRDLVNRYVEAIKVFDEQISVGKRMNDLIGSFYKSEIAFTSTNEGQPLQRAQFKKQLQKSAWDYIFDKMNMKKYATKGLKEDINRFVEQQSHIPFTMRNIYKMLEIVVGTHAQRMDRAMIEVFDKVTSHYHDNRFSVEGWKTNSHFLLTKRFIMPYVFAIGWSGQMETTWYRQWGNYEIINDMLKALCYLSGKNYDNIQSLHVFVNNNKCEWGKWYEWEFFRFRGYKKGTSHFEFIEEDLWGKFNQNVARIKGYPLFDAKSQTKYQKKQTGRKAA